MRLWARPRRPPRLAEVDGRASGVDRRRTAVEWCFWTAYARVAKRHVRYRKSCLARLLPCNAEARAEHSPRLCSFSRKSKDLQYVDSRGLSLSAGATRRYPSSSSTASQLYFNLGCSCTCTSSVTSRVARAHGQRDPPMSSSERYQRSEELTTPLVSS